MAPRRTSTSPPDTSPAAPTVVERPPLAGEPFDEDGADLAAMLREIAELTDEGSVIDGITLAEFDAREGPETGAPPAAGSSDDTQAQ